ncbi:MAG: hypothetical protein ACFHVJ_05765 [Aestuariibacter sp.]
MITSQLAILDQGRNYLTNINDTHYCEVKSPLFSSSAGTHFRHVLDHYLALMHRPQGIINYNIRHRFSKAESSTQAALVVIDDIAHWLLQLNGQDLQENVQVISEIAVDEVQNAETTSTLARELVFVSSHAVHHYSIIKVISTLQNVSLPADFGIAPATASFQRSQAAS